MEELDQLIATFRTGTPEQREVARTTLIQRCTGPSGSDARTHLTGAARREVLEVQWELEDIVELTTPPKPAEPEAPAPAPAPAPAAPPPAPEDPTKPLSAADLDLVYDDPRGLLLHKAKKANRWFATQVDPRTGQPQTFELHPQEIAQLKTQLQGSPYWLVGNG